VLEHFDIIIKLIVSGTAVFGFIKWWIERKSKDKLMAYYEQEIKDDSTNIAAKYNCAISYLKNNEPEKAVYYLNDVIATKDQRYFEEASIYLAEALIKMEKTEPAKTILNSIIERKSRNADKANQMLLELE